MLSHPILRLCALAAAVALMAAAGGAATAVPGGGERSLEPTAQLAAADGGASVPAPSTGGGMSAPAPSEPVPTTPDPAPTPVPPAAPEAPATPPPADETVTGAAPAPVEEAVPDAAEGEQTTVPEPPEPEPVEPPTSEEALGADGSPLVPAEMLGVEIEDAADSPLIDISPAHVAAEPLRSQPELAAAPAQEEPPDDEGGDDDPPDDDGEVIIPVPVDGDDDDDGRDPSQVPAAPAPVADDRGPSLPSTGRELLGPAASALFLLLAGVALRAAAGPSGVPARA